MKIKLAGQTGTSIRLMQKVLMSMEKYLGVSLEFGTLSFKSASEIYLRFTVTSRLYCHKFFINLLELNHLISVLSD